MNPRREWTAGLNNPSAGRDPAWTSGGTTKRPPLNTPCRHVVIHYTGAAATFTGRDPHIAVRTLFMWAHANNKGDEYNYIITPDGQTWEWAGDQRAAHCTSWNTDSVGVLLLVGINEPPPLPMPASLLELRRTMEDAGTITPQHRVGQHREYLGTAPGPSWQPKTGAWQTDCPGAAIVARWPMFAAPLPAPTPPPTTEDDMPGELIGVNDHPNYPTTTRVVYVTDGVGIHYRWVRSEADLAAVQADRAARGWTTHVVQRSYHELGRYGVLVGPAP